MYVQIHGSTHETPEGVKLREHILEHTYILDVISPQRIEHCIAA